jgi:hypothetical protein
MGEVGGLYDARLEVLADAALVEAHLAGWAAQRSLAPSGPWRRVYGKLRPGHSPWARLVYEAAGAPTVQVSLLESDDPETEAPPGSLPAGVLGRLQILPCADDPALPGLPAVLAALDDPRVVRYHPGQRCMVHGGAGVSARYVKVFSDEVDDQREARARWAASVSGALSFAVAEPHGWDAQSRSSWYGVVPGGPVSRGLMGPQGRELARRVGAAVGELASGRLRPGRRVDATAQLARTGRGLARAAAATPGLSAGLRRAGDSLLRAHQRLGERPLVPVHGAAHLGQWLVDGDGRLGLVDFDRFACGDPEFDLATFVVELRDLVKGRPSDGLEAAVVEGFRAVAGGLDEQRLELYTWHKRLARVARMASALRPDAGERAASCLDGLQDPLARFASR